MARRNLTHCNNCGYPNQSVVVSMLWAPISHSLINLFNCMYAYVSMCLCVCVCVCVCVCTWKDGGG